jgi:hypothetical protein
MSLLALDFLPRIIAMRSMRAPLFATLHALGCLSRRRWGWLVDQLARGILCRAHDGCHPMSRRSSIGRDSHAACCAVDSGLELATPRAFRFHSPPRSIFPVADVRALEIWRLRRQFDEVRPAQATKLALARDRACAATARRTNSAVSRRQARTFVAGLLCGHFSATAYDPTKSPRSSCEQRGFDVR